VRTGPARAAPCRRSGNGVMSRGGPTVAPLRNTRTSCGAISLRRHYPDQVMGSLSGLSAFRESAATAGPRPQLPRPPRRLTHILLRPPARDRAEGPGQQDIQSGLLLRAGSLGGSRGRAHYSGQDFHLLRTKVLLPLPQCPTRGPRPALVAAGISVEHPCGRARTSAGLRRRSGSGSRHGRQGGRLSGHGRGRW
jgi:hypothetical protein